MAITIVSNPINPVKWKDAKPMTVYRPPANDLLVLALPNGKAVALRVSEASSAKVGDVWAPGSESTWVEVNARLLLEGDA